MPTYEYACTACEHQLEAIQKMSDDRLVFCPECGEESLKKKLSAPAFKLKGSGWYETDFKNSGAKKPDAGKADKSSAASGSGSGGASSDKKSGHSCSSSCSHAA